MKSVYEIQKNKKRASLNYRRQVAKKKGITLEEHEAQLKEVADKKETKQREENAAYEASILEIRSRAKQREEEQEKIKKEANALRDAEERMDAASDWLLENDLKHPDYEKHIAELHQAEVKIRQLTEPRPSSRNMGGIEMFNTLNLR